MTAIRRTLAALVLGSAIVARPAIGQHAGSVSLTHTVSVTVPPRVKVQVGAASMSSSTSQSVRSNALAVSVSATQAWVLSIGTAKVSQLQWSTDEASGFARVNSGGARIAAGDISQIPAAATLFFRNTLAGKVGEQTGGDSTDPVILTVAAP